MMTLDHDIFIQAFWWLSLIGGIHCFGVALYVRFIYRSTYNRHNILASIFMLVGLYFMTGLLTNDAITLPIHLLLTLLYPLFFLLMPLLYLYSKQSLHPVTFQPHYLKHTLLAMIIALMTTSAILFSIGIDPNATESRVSSITELSRINVFAIILPCLALIQSAIYLALIYRLVKQSRQLQSLNASVPSDNKIEWVTVIAIGILINWIIRLISAYLPFYLGDYQSMIPETITRLSLLVTVYILAFYSLHQVTKAAYLRSINQSTHHPKPTPTSTPVLDDDEMAYLQDVISTTKKTKRTS
ncbi:hypothetical protein [Shewanella gaetbuli]|uniref:Uncharacterized protein n=1 Tax=Shewanella gaetbuli TaxID=220752 RepID=A0A9X1ZWA7_9GAMM|nr:hypothetical protein [Shewanella gaetbuli]MCL1143571.1 hypothetical protein [Shewanella gaetbuli]